jgi:hypothetical protein
MRRLCRRVKNIIGQAIEDFISGEFENEISGYEKLRQKPKLRKSNKKTVRKRNGLKWHS